MPVGAQIQMRRDTAANWASTNPVLAAGEWGYITDGAHGYKIGDGTTAWNSLAFASGGGGAVAYTHTQGSASATWTINHNLGYNPIVTLISVGGLEFDGQVQHTSVNQTVCTFLTAVAGTARLI